MAQPPTQVPDRDVQALKLLGFEFESTSIPIARGAFGHVYKGWCNEFATRKPNLPDPTKETTKRERHEVSLVGRPCVIKMCIIRAVGDTSRRRSIEGVRLYMNTDRLYTEAKMLEELRHPNIAEVYLVFKSGPHRTGPLASDLSDTRVYFVLEYANGGTFTDRMSLSQPNFKEHEALQIIRGLTAGFSYLHRKKIVHGDAHKGNIMFHQDEDNNYKVKIVDLGSTQPLKDISKQRPDINSYTNHLIDILEKSNFTNNHVKTELRLLADRINHSASGIQPRDGRRKIENMDDIEREVIRIIGGKG